MYPPPPPPPPHSQCHQGKRWSCDHNTIKHTHPQNGQGQLVSYANISIATIYPNPRLEGHSSLRLTLSHLDLGHTNAYLSTPDKKKQEIFSRSSAATIYVSLPTSHQVLHLYI